jgi:hypothetical protein
MFAALAADLARCEALVDQARRDGECELATARANGEAAIAYATRETEPARRAAYDRVLAAAAKGDALLTEDAAARAAQITRSGRERLPSAVRRIIESVLSEAVKD